MRSARGLNEERNIVARAVEDGSESKLNVNLADDTIMVEGDTLIVIGEEKKFELLENKAGMN